MRNNPEFNSFQEAREKDLSLREIKESIRKLSIEQRQQLSHEINRQIISELHKWMEVKRWDELNFLKALTLEWNTINWTNQKEADLIVPWDVIKIEWGEILKNGQAIWNVTGFNIQNSWIEQTNETETDVTLVETSEQEDVNSQQDLDEQQSNDETNIDWWLDAHETIETDIWDLINQSWERINQLKLLFLTENYPNFQNLIENHPERIDEWEKRISLSVKLDEALENMWLLNNFMYKWSVEQNINELKRALYTQEDKNFFNNNKLTTRFEWWSRPWSWNMYQLIAREHSYSELIAMLTNDSSTVSEIFWNINYEAINELNNQEKEKMWRLEIFLSSWEKINPQWEYKPSLRRIYETLNNWELRTAINISHDFFRNESNLRSTSIHTIIDSTSWLVDWLRIIWDQEQAALITVENISNIEWHNIDQQKIDRLNNFLEENTQNHVEQNMQQAEEQYNKILEALQWHPEHYEYSLNRENIIQWLARTKAQMNLLDDFINQNWSEWLWSFVQTYDDMKWLYWWLNFSDNTIKLTKEIAIIVWSMAITMWAWALLTWTATIARAWVLASNTQRAASISNAANRSSRIRNAIGAANRARLTRQAWTLSWLARISEVWARWISYINWVPVFWRAFIFTWSESIIRSMSLWEWEVNNSFSDFWENFARNAAMFAMFSWVEKIWRPLSNRLIQRLWMRPENFSSVMVGNVVLTPWDMAWLYILHSIEKWELEIPDWAEFAELAAMSLAFRAATWAANYRRVFNRVNTTINERADFTNRLNNTNRWETINVWDYIYKKIGTHTWRRFNRWDDINNIRNSTLVKSEELINTYNRQVLQSRFGQRQTNRNESNNSNNSNNRNQSTPSSRNTSEKVSNTRNSINTPENNTRIFNNLRERLKNSPDFMREINRRLESMPIVNYPYRTLRFPIHNGENFRYIPRKIGESIATPITTPRDAYINIKNWNYPQAVKNILFSSNDITWKWWIMKVWAYATVPTTIEAIANYDGSAINMTREEFIREVWGDYLSYMYLWAINSIILENLWYYGYEQTTD